MEFSKSRSPFFPVEKRALDGCGQLHPTLCSPYVVTPLWLDPLGSPSLPTPQ